MLRAMSEPLITVLTPTYNRGHLLSNLYHSLLEQTTADFEWMIVDDGSIDNTSDVVESFQADGHFSITYLHKTNGGKHTALNFGIARINTPLTIIVDSDDRLLQNATREIESLYYKYCDDDRIATWSF